MNNSLYADAIKKNGIIKHYKRSKKLIENKDYIKHKIKIGFFKKRKVVEFLKPYLYISYYGVGTKNV